MQFSKAILSPHHCSSLSTNSWEIKQ